MYSALSDIHAWLVNGADSAAGVAEIIHDSFQGPSEGIKGCLFSSAPDCGQLVFGDGFASVYDYTPPDGFESLTGLPVACVPAGLDSNGMPVGLQIVGKQFGEEAVLALASQIQKLRPLSLPSRV